MSLFLRWKLLARESVSKENLFNGVSKRAAAEKSTLGLALPKVMINWTIQAQFSSLTRPEQFNETILSLNHAQHVAYTYKCNANKEQKISNFKFAVRVLNFIFSALRRIRKALGAKPVYSIIMLLLRPHLFPFIYSTRAAASILSRVRSFTHTHKRIRCEEFRQQLSQMKNNTRAHAVIL